LAASSRTRLRSAAGLPSDHTAHGRHHVHGAGDTLFISAPRPSRGSPTCDQVLVIYGKSLAILNSSSTFFIDDTTSAEAAKGHTRPCSVRISKVNFTPAFKERSGTTGFGRIVRAAMVLHEPVHIADHPAAIQRGESRHENSPKVCDATGHEPIAQCSIPMRLRAQVFFNGIDTRFGVGKPAL